VENYRFEVINTCHTMRTYNEKAVVEEIEGAEEEKLEREKIRDWRGKR